MQADLDKATSAATATSRRPRHGERARPIAARASALRDQARCGDQEQEGRSQPKDVAGHEDGSRGQGDQPNDAARAARWRRTGGGAGHQRGGRRGRGPTALRRSSRRARSRASPDASQPAANAPTAPAAPAADVPPRPRAGACRSATQMRYPGQGCAGQPAPARGPRRSAAGRPRRQTRRRYERDDAPGRRTAARGGASWPLVRLPGRSRREGRPARRGAASRRGLDPGCQAVDGSAGRAASTSGRSGC